MHYFKAVRRGAVPGEYTSRYGPALFVPGKVTAVQDDGKPLELGRRGLHVCTVLAGCFLNTGFRHPEDPVLRVTIPESARVATDGSGVVLAATAVHVVDVMPEDEVAAVLGTPAAVMCRVWGCEVWTRYGAIHRTRDDAQDAEYAASAAVLPHTPLVRSRVCKHPGAVRCVMGPCADASIYDPDPDPDDLPAYVDPATGARVWMWRGALHRGRDLPAHVSRRGVAWYRHGLLHRDPRAVKGRMVLPPAEVMADGGMRWALHGHVVKTVKAPDPACVNAALYPYGRKRARTAGPLAP